MKPTNFPRLGVIGVCAAALLLGALSPESVGAQSLRQRTVGAQTVAAQAAANATPTTRPTPKRTTTKKRRRVPAKTVKPLVATTTTVTATAATTTVAVPTTSLAQPLPVTTSPATPVAPVTVTLPSVTAPADPTTTTKKPVTTTTTTTLPPAPFPAPANPPTRPAAATLEPYRGLGAWVDRIDWSVRFSGKPNPPVSAQTMDEMAAAGVQTVYIQGAHWAGQIDVLEPERLLPMINRAHELGMYVVLWYLPAFQDVNTDLRKVVALANLDVDGINIDIEDYYTIPEINERNRRLIQFSSSLRQLLPGRYITNDIVEPTMLDGVPNLWTQPNGAPPKSINSFWRGPFPYRDLAPHYDLWMIQTYWTNRAADSGWRDGYRYVIENVNRLRAATGRPDLPIHVIGGVGDKAKVLNDLSGFQLAARQTGSVGISFYDWVVWPRDWWRYSWGFRRPNADLTLDPRFPATEPPGYVPSTQPPITTTIVPPPTTKPTAVPVVGATVTTGASAVVAVSSVPPS